MADNAGPNMEIRALLAVVLTIVVMVGYQYFFVPPPEEPAVQERTQGKAQETTGAATTEDGGAPATEGEGDAAETGGRSGDEGPGGAAADGESAARRPEEGPGVAAAPPPAAVSAESEKRIVVDTGRLRATLTNRGGRLQSAILPGYESDAGGPVELVRQDYAASGERPLDLLMPAAPGRAAEANEALYRLELEGGEPIEGGRRATPESPVTVRFQWSDGADWAVEKTLVFRAGGDLIDLRVAARTPGGVPAHLALGPGLVDAAGGETSSRYLTSGAAIYRNEELEVWAPDDLEEGEQTFDGPITWTGVQSNYFLALVVPDGPAEVRFLLSTLAARPAARAAQGEDGGEPTQRTRVAIRVPPEGLDAPLYLGPKDYEHLGELGYQLQAAVDFGIFSFFVIPLYRGLLWLHGYVGNYGVAIVLLTVLIKLLFLPLTQKAYTSMQKMRELQPRMNAIRNKYKDVKDLEKKQEMNKELMALYKDEGVSPLGGCLPMLLQLPVLYAFYSLLSVAIELRHAPFFLWIHDLAKHDPYLILPILMGASMYVQQSISPSGAGDAMQAKMFKFMPVFMTVFFLYLPSGLVLYWFVNNLLGIGQQFYIQRQLEADKDQRGGSTKADKGRKRKRGKKK